MGQLIEFVRFAGNFVYGGFRGPGIRILHQNLGDTIFGGPCAPILQKIYAKLENRGSDRVGDVYIVFLVQFYKRKGHICKNFLKRLNLGKLPYKVRAIFLVNLSNSSNFQETLVMVFSRTRNSNLPSKFRWHHFRGPYAPILQKIYAKLENRGSDRIGDIVFLVQFYIRRRAHLQKLSKRPNFGKCTFYSRGIFLSIYRIRSLYRKLRLWSF